VAVLGYRRGAYTVLLGRSEKRILFGKPRGMIYFI